MKNNSQRVCVLIISPFVSVVKLFLVEYTHRNIALGALDLVDLNRPVLNALKKLVVNRIDVSHLTNGIKNKCLRALSPPNILFVQ